MVATTYISNLKKMGGLFTRVFYICNFLPKNYELKKHERHIIELAPNKATMNAYKNNIIDTTTFFEYYNNQILFYSKDLLKEILDKYANDNIAFVCYEKDYNECHRKRLGEYIKNEFNIEVIEL